MAGPHLSMFACLVVTSLYSFAFIRPQKRLYIRCLLASPVVALYLCVPVLIYDVQTAVLPPAVVGCIVSWLSSFKLIMLACRRGPLVDPKVDESLFQFCAILCCPIQLRPSIRKGLQKKKEGILSLFGQSLLKVAILLITLQITDMWEVLHPLVYHFFWYFNLYLFISTVINLFGALTSWVLGVGLLPDFDRPFLSASVSDFWARRWNLTVSSLLRESVYDPLLERAVIGHSDLLTQANSRARGGMPNGNVTKQDGFKDAPAECPSFLTLEERLVPMLAAFAVSGIMHELIFWYITHTISGEVTAFFVLHGVAVCVERWVRRSHPKMLQPPKAVRTLLTLIFCFGTAEWLSCHPLSDQVTILK
jgi:hypothetical protein